jgi:hypothetical protein
MKNFLTYNYGVIIGAVIGFLLPIPLGMLLGGIAGLIYHRKPEWFGADRFKPRVDAWVDRTLTEKTTTNNRY